MIRQATCEDIPQLVALQQTLEAEGALHGYRSDSATDWAARDLAWTLVAARGGRIVGFVHGRLRPSAGECIYPADARVLEIVELVVERAHRSHGLGRELVEAVSRKARQDGFTHLRVYSAARRFDDIVRFYRSCGFSPWYLEMTRSIVDEPNRSGS